ncbi:glycosyltransferase [Pseudomonas sp. MWU13-2105]|uniref:glycosyltransferase n=1 Tax=Pseudomonas sp. MWU13-2105 TaxID=2935074 RepID=UPI00200E84C3|nr:glycosyltransferase [Pseudomonas sp. MWU13-2105]
MARALPQQVNYSIALVNYKTHELTRTCLELLQAALRGTDAPVFVVDNDSNDASIDYLRSLDWINLIERKSLAPEVGSAAHGRALDLALAAVETEYLFLLHTDTFIHDPEVFGLMIRQCSAAADVVAVGCLEQLHRGVVRSAWRLISRFTKHYTRRGLRALGLNARAPSPFREKHLKSFCTLWNTRLIKQHGLHFHMNGGNPGYELQDRMSELGYRVECIAPRRLFRYLDHIQSGTVAATGGFASNHRRLKMYYRLSREPVAALPASPYL